MKYVLFFLCITMISCSKEPGSGATNKSIQTEEASGGELSRMINQSPPFYLSEVCEDKKTNIEKRKCGDQKLIQEIDQIVINHTSEVSDIDKRKLIFEFDILPNGRLENIVVKNGVHPMIDKEVGLFLSKTKWSPGIHNGKKVKITRRLPIFLNGQ